MGAADANEDMGLCGRSVLRRDRRGVLRELQGRSVPDDFFFNISVFILCMVILGGMGNVWGVIVGGGFLAYLNQEGLGNIGAEINETFSTNIDVPLYQFGIFGVILVLVMLFKPEGLIEQAPQGGVRGGRPRRAPLRRAARA